MAGLEQSPNGGAIGISRGISRRIQTDDIITDLTLDEPTLKKYSEVAHQRSKNSEVPSDQKKINEMAAAAIETDKEFRCFLSSLNVNDLNDRLINFGNDVDLVNHLETVIDHLKLELPNKFGFGGELIRIGSCEDGSKVGNVNELDCLYVINTNNVAAQKQRDNNYYLSVDGKILKPGDIQERLGDAVEAVLFDRKWKTQQLIHGGFLSPKFSGVRYSGPAVTLLMIYEHMDGKATIRRPISLDITAAFHFPSGTICSEIKEHIKDTFQLVTPLMQSKVLKLTNVHLVPNVFEDTWLISTAELEAMLFRDLNDKAPVKEAFSYVKIIINDMNAVNQQAGGLFERQTEPMKDELQSWDISIDKYIRYHERDPGNAMRLAHAFMSKTAAERLNELGKSDISPNTAALKHILLLEALQQPKLFTARENLETLEEEVYRLVVKVFEILSELKPDLPSIQHAMLNETRINVFAVSKRSLLHRTHHLLQTLVIEQCQHVYKKLDGQQWTCIEHPAPSENSLLVGAPYEPVPAKYLVYPEYTYEIPTDLSIPPNRNQNVCHALIIINALMNTCGGVVALRHTHLVMDTSVSRWLTRWNDICKGYDIRITKLQTFRNNKQYMRVNVSAVHDSRSQIANSSSTFCTHERKWVSKASGTVLEVFVQPAAHHVWYRLSESTRVRYEVQKDGLVKVMTEKAEKRHMNYASDYQEPPQVNNQSFEPNKSSTPADAKKAKSQVAPKDRSEINTILKNETQLSLVEQHKKAYTSYIDIQLPNVNPRLDIMADVLKLASPLSIFPDLHMAPDDVKSSLMEIAKLYDNKTGFGVWFQDIDSSITTEITDHVYLLCYTKGETKFDMWSVYQDPALGGGAGADLKEKAKMFKWQAFVHLRRNKWMSCATETINLTVSCRPNRHVDIGTELPYPLCEAPSGDGVTFRLCAVMAEILIINSTSIYLQKSLHDNLLLNLSYDQCKLIINFGSHQLNFIEGPPGSGKSVIARYLSDMCWKMWGFKPMYFCASSSMKAILDQQGKCYPYVIDSDTYPQRNIRMEQGDKGCLIVDDAHSIPWSKKTWLDVLGNVVRSNIYLYLFTDHQYQDFRQLSSANLWQWLSNISDAERVSLNKSHLSTVHRNSHKVVSFIGASFPDKSTVSPSTKITCGHNEAGDDVALIKVSNLFSQNKDNGLLLYIQRLTEEYEPRHIAIIIDHKNFEQIIQKIKLTLEKYMEPKCEVHRADIYPRKGIIVDNVDNFVGIDAPVCVYPILGETAEESRCLDNPKYRAFIASRAVFKLVIVQAGNFQESDTSRFQLDHLKLRSLLDYSSVLVSHKYSGRGEIFGREGGFHPWGVAACPITGRVVVTDTYSHTIHVLSDGLRQVAVFGGPGQVEGQYRGPRGVCVNSRGDSVYISDAGNNRVQVSDFTGCIQLVISETTGARRTMFRNPSGLTIYKHQVYVCDSGNSRVVVMSEIGEYVREFSLSSGFPGAKRPTPVNIAVTEDCVAVAGQTDKNDIYLVTPDGALIQTLTHTDDLPLDPKPEDLVHEDPPPPGVFGQAQGVCFDANQHLILTSARPSSVHVIGDLGRGAALSHVTHGMVYPIGVTALLNHSLVVCNYSSTLGSVVKFSFRDKNC